MGIRGKVMQDQCSCGCVCPAALTIEDEVKMLESHKNTLQDQIEFLNRKIAVLISVKEE